MATFFWKPLRVANDPYDQHWTFLEPLVFRRFSRETAELILGLCFRRVGEIHGTVGTLNSY